jgi:beta-N-acetylhexosaminidase
LSDPERPSPRAVIFGCAGPRLSDPETLFFAAAEPAGFILFDRNCRDPGQVRDLVAALRACVGRPHAPVLIDQEGGRVARLGPPHWRSLPAAGRIGALAQGDAELGREAAWTVARLIASDLQPLGITVDCAPVLDVPAPGAHGIIGDRAIGPTPKLAADLGRAFCEGLLAGGVIPVIKHIPGHGRATVDSHAGLPIVDAAREALEQADFAPFRALADMPWAMTAHVLYRALDARLPATTSSAVIGEVIRGAIGFDGVLVSDDLSMEALSGTPGERAAAALAAGCDLVLHCNASHPEMEEVAAATPPVSATARARLSRAEAMREPPQEADATALAARLHFLMGEAAAIG